MHAGAQNTSTLVLSSESWFEIPSCRSQRVVQQNAYMENAAGAMSQLIRMPPNAASVQLLRREHSADSMISKSQSVLRHNSLYC